MNSHHKLLHQIRVTIHKECRGLRPVPEFGADHQGDARAVPRKTPFPYFAAVGGIKELAI